MRKKLVNFLLEEAHNMASDWMVWEDLAMLHALDIANELDVRDIAQNFRISTLEDYAL